MQFWLHWVFVAAGRLSLVAASGGYSSLQRSGFSLRRFSCCGAQAPGSRASVVAACGLSGVAHGLGCSVACQIFSDQGQNPSPELAGRLLSSAPPGKSFPFGFILRKFLCAQWLSRVRLVRPYGLQPARLLCPWGFSM